MNIQHGIDYSNLSYIDKHYKDLTPLQFHLLQTMVQNRAEWDIFLKPELSSLYSPFLLPDIAKSITLIKETVKSNKKIMIFGDRDTDGVSSTSLLGIFFKDYYKYKDDRLVLKTSSQNEDYGLCKPALDFVKQTNPSLFITLDFGTSNHEEIEELNKEGIKVIVIDHHEIPSKIPSCLLINPKREDSKYPETKICTSVIVMKLIWALYLSDFYEKQKFASNEYDLFNQPVINYNEIDIPQSVQKNPKLLTELKRLLDLSSIGTITDMMPLRGENRIIVKNGIMTLSDVANNRNPNRQGLFYLINHLKLNNNNITSKDLGWSIGPALNAAGRMGKTEIALELLLSDSDSKSLEYTAKLMGLNGERKERTKRNVYRAEMYFQRNPEKTTQKVIFCYEPDMEPGVSGIVATKLTEKFEKPAIFITPDHGHAKGSIRSYGSENVLNLLNLLEDLFLQYGGHPEASGFSVEIDKIPLLEKRIYDIADKWLETEDVSAQTIAQTSDFSIYPKELTLSLYKELLLFEPFGQENPRPLISIKRARVLSYRTMSEGQHARFSILEADSGIKCLIWNRAAELEKYISQNSEIDFWGYLEENYFNGNTSIQFVVKDFR
ncbi:MAG: single-stranded-DNA-specific exonuclease RecJ [Leptospiraceae bacterium]|nr:single-stranded-DNA-specific exonuclease RecJ [Leptospiraceae bacterium]MCP5493744.1 single-stranded-DNA-specific exonuclease RecJ [Leptospiraceae bacterium]